MAAVFKIHLRAGERLYLNGAILRAERKVTLSIENKAAFLLEGHVMAVAEATTPLRRHYIAVQSMIIEPMRAVELMEFYRLSHRLLAATFSEGLIADELAAVDAAIAEGRLFEGLNRLRALIARDELDAKPTATCAAPAVVNS